MRHLAALTALVVFASCAATARADGDPASDVLIAQNIFFPYGGGTVSSDSRAALESVVAKANKANKANKAHFRIKVAVIATKLDLGAITVLWRKPQTYAKFLGGELLFVYKKGRLLIVMPNGWGLYRGTKREQALLTHIPTGKSADQLVKAATKAVQKLAAASGVKVKPSASGSKSSSSDNRLAIALGGVAILALLGLLTYLYLPRRRAALKRSHAAKD